MKSQSHAATRMVSLVLLYLLFFSSGCATIKPAKPMTAEQLEKVKASLGHVGIVHVSYLPSIDFQLPAKGAASGAGKGMAAGAAAPFKMIAGCNGGEGCGLLAVIAIASVPFTTVIGGVGGAIIAEPAEKVKVDEAALNEALSKVKMQEAFAARVIEKTKEIENLKTSFIDGKGPAIEGAGADYGSLEGVDTVKEVALKSFQLKGEGYVNPPMSLLMTASARLVKPANGSEIYSKTFTCSKGKAIFADWAAKGGQMLQEATEGCYDELARKIVDDIYVMDTLVQKDGS